MVDVAQVSAPTPAEPAGVLGPDGTPRPGEQVVERPELLLDMYRWMVFGRAFDTRLFNLQRQGRLSTYAPYVGQEACQVGCGLAMRKDDWLFTTYRDSMAGVIRGRPAEHVIYYFMGNPKMGLVPPDVNVPPPQVGIAEHIPHAVGVAWGMKLRGDGAATVALFGEGATSEGAFHEAANFAGVMKAPVVLVCQNNGWAISVPRSRQTASETIAQKALAYGIAGGLVDGNDVLAVYREVSTALDRARSGGGATLIEAQTYRVGPHTTSDDPTRYRVSDELGQWQSQRDPIARLRAYLERQGLWDDSRQASLDEETRERVAAIVTTAMAEPAPGPGDMFLNVYGTHSPELETQSRDLLEHLSRNTDHGELPRG